MRARSGGVQVTAALALLVSLGRAHAQTPAAEDAGPVKGSAVAAQPGSKPQPPVDLDIQLELPTRDQLFRPESEATSRARVREKALRQNTRLEYPPETAPAAGQPVALPSRPPQVTTVVPDVVCYHPLYFEDRNTERYGWRTFPVQPVLSTGRFYLDALLFPCHLIVHPPWVPECNTGYPKPGDPVPFHCYLLPWNAGNPAASRPCLP